MLIKNRSLTADVLTNPQKPFVRVRKIVSYAFQRLAIFGCGIRSFVHGASPTCLAELIQSNVLDILDLEPRGGGGIQQVYFFMILLFLFSLYFWINALFHITSTFDPLRSFSRTAEVYFISVNSISLNPVPIKLICRKSRKILLLSTVRFLWQAYLLEKRKSCSLKHDDIREAVKNYLADFVR